MYDFYGIYTACRDAAWRCHVDFGVKKLPVMLHPIASAAGIRVVRNSDVNELREKEHGASLFVDGRWIIIYDDTLENAEVRMIIAHELGHIFLGHDYKYANYRFQSEKAALKSEREADLFAIRLLAPACVLHELSVHNPEMIAELCRIPCSAAKKRSARMVMLEKRNCFYKSRLESEAALGFRLFIDEKRAEMRSCSKSCE